MQDQHSKHHDDSPRDGRSTERQRQTLVLAFVIILIWLSGAVTAQSQTAAVVPGNGIVSDDANRIDESVDRRTAQGRPALVDLDAALANFDANVWPDGWRTTLRLLDRNDAAVSVHANATYTLHYHSGAYRSDQKALARWSRRVEFDESGTAHIRLPAQMTTRQALGWKSQRGWSAQPIRDLALPNDRFVERRGRPGRWQSAWPSERPSNRNRTWSFGVVDGQEQVWFPISGWLSVRVDVPGSGSFRAVTPVLLRMPHRPFLVDRSGTYR